MSNRPLSQFSPFNVSFIVFTALLLSFQSFIAHAQQGNWVRLFYGKSESIAFNPLSNGRTIFTACSDSTGLYRSDNGGMTWVKLTDGLEPFAPSGIRQILVLPSDTSIVVAISSRKLYRSTNGGRSFLEVPGLGGIQGEDIAYHDATDILYYGQNFAGPTWKSTDHGANWTQTGTANIEVGLCTLAVSPSTPPILLAGSEDGVIARSSNEGSIWEVRQFPDTGAGLEPEVPKIVFAAQSDQGIAIATRWRSAFKSVVKSIDNGLTFSPLPFNSSYSWALDIDQRQSATIALGAEGYPGPRRFWVGLFGDRSDTVTNGMVQETTDGGLSWHSTGFPTGQLGDDSNPVTRDVSVLKYDTASNTLAAATSTGLYLTHPSLLVEHVGAAPSALTTWQSLSKLVVTSQDRLGLLRLYDCLGRMYRTIRTSELRADFDINDLSPGLYFLEQDSAPSSRIVTPILIR